MRSIIRSLDVNTEWIIFWNSRLSHAALINRSRRKRITGRKRHAETDKVSSSTNTSRRSANGTAVIYTSDALIISIVFRLSDENKREGTFYARSRSTISSLFRQTAADRDRPADRIDSHRSGLDTPFLLVPRYLPNRYIYRRGASVFSFANPVRKHCLRRFQRPLCRITRVLSESDRLLRSLCRVVSSIANILVWN